MACPPSSSFAIFCLSPVAAVVPAPASTVPSAPVAPHPAIMTAMDRGMAASTAPLAMPVIACVPFEFLIAIASLVSEDA